MDKYQIQSAYIEITSMCNMNCRHCYNSSKIKSNSSLSTDDFNYILNKIYDCMCRQLIISGGEPLLHQELIVFITMANNLGFNDISIITNGTIYNREFAKLCSNIDAAIIISFDGIDKKSYSVFRDETRFDSVKNNIIKYAQGNYVELNLILNKYNYSTFEDIICFANSNKIKAVNILNLDSTGRARSFYNKVLMNSLELAKSELIIEATKQKYPDVHIQGFVNPIMCTSCRYLTNRNLPLNIRIDSNGELYACSAASESIGNVINEDFLSLLANANKSNRKKVWHKFVSVYKECSKCIFVNMCKKGCPMAFDFVEQIKPYCENCKSIYINNM